MKQITSSIQKTQPIPLLILTGPTGVGKTDLSLLLAEQLNGEIISADSIQVYRYMDIGSAKIMPDEMKGIRHHLIDILSPDEEFNVFEFQKRAKEAITRITERGKLPIMTGGTGFYIQSVLYDITFNIEDNHHTVREKYRQMVQEKGLPYVYEQLRQIDPDGAAAIHPNNEKRILRALEYFENTGEPISVHNKRESQKTSPYRFLYIVLNRERKTLYDRIDKRVDKMLAQGLVKEVEGLLSMGYDRNLVSMQGLGYKEIAAYLCGECSLNDAVEILKRDTRHFAKRQLTWFRREKCVTFIQYEDYDNDINRMCEKICQCWKELSPDSFR